MQPVLPEGLKLDFKATSYKKLGKFFSTMEKKKIITCKTVFGLDSIEKVTSSADESMF